jgi:HEAT repeat protein
MSGRDRPTVPEVAVRRPPAAAPPAIPLPGPVVPAEAPPAAPLAKGLRRWAIDHLPEGWDPLLAEKIVRFFEEMEIDPLNAEDEERRAKLQDLREEFARFLAGLGPEAIPTLAAILNTEPDFSFRRFLIAAIGDLGPKSEEATFVLKDFYDKSRDNLAARSEMNHVIEAMGHLKNETAYQVMTENLAPGTPAYYRDKFIQALGEHPRRAEAIPRIVEILHEEGDANCRNHAAQYLGKTRRAEDIADLIGAYENERYLPVQQTILGSLGKIGDETALPFLEQEARTGESDGVRLSAANAIRRIGTPRAMKILGGLLQVERSDMIRSNIQEWIQGQSTKGN